MARNRCVGEGAMWQDGVYYALTNGWQAADIMLHAEWREDDDILQDIANEHGMDVRSAIGQDWFTQKVGEYMRKHYPQGSWWYAYCCTAGCLPESEWFGPFTTAEDAEEDVRE